MNKKEIRKIVKKLRGNKAEFGILKKVTIDENNIVYLYDHNDQLRMSMPYEQYENLIKEK